MLAREVGPKIGFWKPVVVSHHLVMGLQGPSKMDMDLKMSKSKPDSAIFVHDSPDEIRAKLRKAHCPEKEVKNNPIMEYFKYIIFRGDEKEIKIERPDKFGGEITVSSYEELEGLYKQGKIHPLDLKNSLAEILIKMLEPCRKRIKESDLAVFKSV